MRCSCWTVKPVFGGGVCARAASRRRAGGSERRAPRRDGAGRGEAGGVAIGGGAGRAELLRGARRVPRNPWFFHSRNLVTRLVRA